MCVVPSSICWLQDMSPKQQPKSQKPRASRKKKAFDFSLIKSVEPGYVLDWATWDTFETDWKDTVRNKLIATGLKNLFCGSEPYFREDVLLFYHNLKLTNGSIQSVVCGTTFFINPAVLQRIFELQGTV